MNLCIIPAKERSTRLPGKNYRKFNGLSMVQRAELTADNSGIFDRVIVSDASNRPRHLMSDGVGLIEVILHHAAHSDIVCCLLPCTPLLTVDILQDAYTRFVLSGATALIPVIPYSGHYFRALKNNNGTLEMLDPDMYHKHSQNLPTVYADADCFWFFKTDAIRQEQKIYPTGSIPYIMNEMDVQGVDTFNDWNLMEAKYEWKKNRNHCGNRTELAGQSSATWTDDRFRKDQWCGCSESPTI